RVCGVCGTEIARTDHVLEANGMFPCRRCGKKCKAIYIPAESWRQRYLCRDCGRHYTIQSEDTASQQRRRVRWALILYLAGLSTHTIAKALSVSHVTVLNWLQKYGADFDEIRKPNAQLVALRDSHSYHDKTSQGKPQGEGLLLIEQRDNTLISLSTLKREKKDLWTNVFDNEYYLVSGLQQSEDAHL
ncbi:MAG: helix-turn-helix domain-containing protein, partial [Tannerella sp.]|nr:helix-turn-helix domain-containing protein [Tannerella sp.]